MRLLYNLRKGLWYTRLIEDIQESKFYDVSLTCAARKERRCHLKPLHFVISIERISMGWIEYLVR